jgi:regulatory protein YycI of two-component signal transduction system YycFG
MLNKTKRFFIVFTFLLVILCLEFFYFVNKETKQMYNLELMSHNSIQYLPNDPDLISKEKSGFVYKDNNGKN